MFSFLFDFFRNLRIWVQDGLVKAFVAPKAKGQAVLITKLDAIGDYILFRNYLKNIRRAFGANDVKIVLVGNILWKNLAETYDAHEVDEFIWVDRTRFRREYLYRWKIMKQIRNYNFIRSCDFVYSREFVYGDAINRVCRANTKIAWHGDNNNTNKFWKTIADTFYTVRVELREILFEFKKNKILVENFVGTAIPTPELTFNLNKEKPLKQIVVFPGASDPGKQWSTENFVEVLLFFLHGDSSIEIKIGGSKSEKYLGDEIIDKLKEEFAGVGAQNLCGVTSLSEVVNLINESALLLSNDTSAVHIAAACKTKTICVAHGRHLGRFVPYPKDVSDTVYCIFPFEVKVDSEQFRSQQLEMLYQPIFSVDQIKPEQVISFIRKSNIIVL